MGKTILGNDPFSPPSKQAKNTSGAADKRKEKNQPPPAKAAAKTQAKKRAPVATEEIRAEPVALDASAPGASDGGVLEPYVVGTSEGRAEVAVAGVKRGATSDSMKRVSRGPAQMTAALIDAQVSYGPPISAAPPPERREILAEVHQLERRICERTSTNLEDRRRVPFALIWKIWRRLAMRARSDSVDDFGRDPRVSQRMTPVVDFIYRRYFRVEAEGLAHIPDQGRALLVSNHSGTIPYDGTMVMHAVRSQHPARREVRPLVEDFVFHFPYLGTLINRIGCVRACPENAARLLANEQLVAVFPEGVKGIGKLYSQRYQLQRFGRGGFIKLALTTGSPIIPTAVVGAEEIHPMLARMTWLARPLGLPYIPITPTFPWLGLLGLIPLPTKWYILFGEPLYFNIEYGPDAAKDPILVNKLAEQVRKRIQEMVDGLLKRRQSVMHG